MLYDWAQIMSSLKMTQSNEGQYNSHFSLKSEHKQLLIKQDKITRKMSDLSGHEFSINSAPAIFIGKRQTNQDGIKH